MAEHHEDEAMLDNEEDKVEILPLSEDERKVLELYDRLQNLQLEVAVLNASRKPVSIDDNDPRALQTGQTALLDAQATYKLRNDAMELVMTANPILKAVHGGTNASPVERDLLPYIERRDKVSISVAKEASDTRKIRGELTEVQSDTIRICRDNIDLTSRLFDLAEQLKAKKAVDVDDSQAQGEIRRLEDELRASRRRWRVIKGVASAVVVGSGVDWARDDVLREIVLDPENED